MSQTKSTVINQGNFANVSLNKGTDGTLFSAAAMAHFINNKNEASCAGSSQGLVVTDTMQGVTRVQLAAETVQGLLLSKPISCIRLICLLWDLLV